MRVTVQTNRDLVQWNLQCLPLLVRASKPFVQADLTQAPLFQGFQLLFFPSGLTPTLKAQWLDPLFTYVAGVRAPVCVAPRDAMLCSTIRVRIAVLSASSWAAIMRLRRTTIQIECATQALLAVPPVKGPRVRWVQLIALCAEGYCLVVSQCSIRTTTQHPRHCQEHHPSPKASELLVEGHALFVPEASACRQLRPLMAGCDGMPWVRTPCTVK